jgi:hypothetical protein
MKNELFLMRIRNLILSVLLDFFSYSINYVIFAAEYALVHSL